MGNDFCVPLVIAALNQMVMANNCHKASHNLLPLPSAERGREGTCTLTSVQQMPTHLPALLTIPKSPWREWRRHWINQPEHPLLFPLPHCLLPFLPAVFPLAPEHKCALPIRGFPSKSGGEGKINVTQNLSQLIKVTESNLSVFPWKLQNATQEWYATVLQKYVLGDVVKKYKFLNTVN